jgi:hypothetical protein
MRSRQGFSTRAAFAAVVFGVVIATAGLTTATAAGASGFGGPNAPTTAAFTGTAQSPVLDPSCPRDPNFTSDVNFRQQISGRVQSRIGSGRLSLDLCRIFSGAIGGVDVQGSFTLATRIGTLRGTARGVISFSVPNEYRVVLTVQRGTFLLSHVTGTLNFDATESRDSPGPLTGTVTPHLTLVRSPGHCSHPVPWGASA